MQVDARLSVKTADLPVEMQPRVIAETRIL